MTSEWQQVANDLRQGLGLPSAPIQISYLDQPPTGVPRIRPAPRRSARSSPRDARARSTPICRPTRPARSERSSLVCHRRESSGID